MLTRPSTILRSSRRWGPIAVADRRGLLRGSQLAGIPPQGFMIVPGGKLHCYIASGPEGVECIRSPTAGKKRAKGDSPDIPGVGEVLEAYMGSRKRVSTPISDIRGGGQRKDD